ncbi:MAG TPA: GNAT family N-acetyltransferase [Chitinophagaceae bacterium]|nr:GNAT family N-acetyltransferase [Chitinophagaceae bacterium]
MNAIINWQPAHLQTGLVSLVPLAATDFDRLYAVAADPLIWEQHPSSDRYKEEVFREFFNGALASQAAFLIVDTATQQVIGSTRFYDYKPGKSIAIGYTFLARRYWGGKYNGVVKSLMLNYAFQYVDTVIFHIGATNLRSQIATMRLGAVKTGEFTTQEANGQKLSYEYSLHRITAEK